MWTWIVFEGITVATNASRSAPTCFTLVGMGMVAGAQTLVGVGANAGGTYRLSLKISLGFAND